MLTILSAGPVLKYLLSGTLFSEVICVTNAFDPMKICISPQLVVVVFGFSLRVIWFCIGFAWYD